jgi:hypothetical protein
MSKNFIEDAQFREGSDTDKIISVLQSMPGCTDVTVTYDVDLFPKRRVPILLIILFSAVATALVTRIKRRARNDV